MPWRWYDPEADYVRFQEQENSRKAKRLARVRHLMRRCRCDVCGKPSLAIPGEACFMMKCNGTFQPVQPAGQ